MKNCGFLMQVVNNENKNPKNWHLLIEAYLSSHYHNTSAIQEEKKKEKKKEVLRKFYKFMLS